ncbi:hypothetical protein NM688_g6015 [Phlebia brevispora]|uniref:Uncharacterized protein n=1 Tax=Phlebia brevispora TaxID=194682 RepID=A0ACC1SLH8_9APHY|nr:hypothetical protein NM688_g6015 [Phlebia brevispora]
MTSPRSSSILAQVLPLLLCYSFTMQSVFTLAVIVSFFHLAVAQNPPACFTNCIEIAVADYSSGTACEPTDLTCQCSDSYFNNVMSNCIAADCPYNRYTAATEAWSSTCATSAPSLDLILPFRDLD